MAAAVKERKKREKPPLDGFDEVRAQIAFREQTGRMFSKRGATVFHGPSAEKEEMMKREAEQRYQPLKPFAPEDGTIEKLAPPINEEEIINAWRTSVEKPLGKGKSKEKKSEADRARELIKSKSGLKRGLTFSSTRGSYRPPNSNFLSSTGGWNSYAAEPKLLGAYGEEDGRLKGWRTDELRNVAWWDDRWKKRDMLREEKGRLVINPVTGKLEDIAVGVKVTFPEKVDDRRVADLLMADDLPFEVGRSERWEGKEERVTVDGFVRIG